MSVEEAGTPITRGEPLVAEDEARLTRLYEEIVSRYVEVSLIKARAVERTNPELARLIRANPVPLRVQLREEAAKLRVDYIECFGCGEEMGIIHWVDDKGVGRCAPCTCG